MLIEQNVAAEAAGAQSMRKHICDEFESVPKWEQYDRCESERKEVGIFPSILSASNDLACSEDCVVGYVEDSPQRALI